MKQEKYGKWQKMTQQLQIIPLRPWEEVRTGWLMFNDRMYVITEDYYGPPPRNCGVWGTLRKELKYEKLKVHFATKVHVMHEIWGQRSNLDRQHALKTKGPKATTDQRSHLVQMAIK